MTKPFVVAIDGPSASCKGTLAKKIAAHFDFPFLNTGAIYRLVAFRIIDWNFDPENFDKEIPELVTQIAEADLEQEKLFSEEIGAVASVIAKNQNLRSALFAFQKKFVAQGLALRGGVVLDGRDTTTVICPDAEFKFFVTADVEIRAQRRFDQLKKQGKNVSYEEILSQLKKRDESDLNRADSPLKIAADAFVIDNGKLSIEEGFQKILFHINAKN